MNFLAEYGMFLLKAFTLVAAFLILLAGIFAIKRQNQGGLSIVSVNDDAASTKSLMYKQTKSSKPPKAKKLSKDAPRVYVLEFSGDIKASQVERLRDEVSAVLSVANALDRVIIRLESPGGSVPGYGLAASQLQRLRDKQIPLTVCIDKVAASGGYLMACVADEIIAAPFAIIGSIGVVAQIPNLHRWLKSKNIDVELMTAGEYKRTLTVFGENTEKGRQKFQEDLELIHSAFRQYVLSHRHELNIDEVSTGEHWLAVDAIKLRLVDKLMSSDDYIHQFIETHQVYEIKLQGREGKLERLLKPAAKFLNPMV